MSNIKSKYQEKNYSPNRQLTCIIKIAEEEANTLLRNSSQNRNKGMFVVCF